MKKTIFIGLAVTVSLIFAFIFSLPDGRLHVVFCDVGQGDAAYIRSPDGQDILIDGGPNEKVLDCLGKNMPFYDRTIDVVLLSHPQKDHFQGIQSVMERYHVKYFISSPVAGEGEAYQKLISLIREKKIPVKLLYTGDRFSMGKVEFDILWPEKEWVARNASFLGDLSYSRLRQDFGGQVSNLEEGGGKVLGLSTGRDLNDFSYYLHLTYGQFDVLFTGDGGSHIQGEVEKVEMLPDVEVLKFPHHGSKTGVLPEFLDKVRPELAVISVGKNSYGHPAEEALKLLRERDIEIKRTDRDGNIEMTSDGKGWKLGTRD